MGVVGLKEEFCGFYQYLMKRISQLIVELTNKALGYRELEVWTPEELMEDDV